MTNRAQRAAIAAASKSTTGAANTASEVTSAPALDKGQETANQIPVTIIGSDSASGTAGEPSATDTAAAPGAAVGGVAGASVLSDGVGALGASNAETEPPAKPEVAVLSRGVAKFDADFFPMEVVLRNHGPIPLVETMSGKYLSNGGAESVQVQSEAHLNAIRENLNALAELNYFDPALLVIDGLPATDAPQVE